MDGGPIDKLTEKQRACLRLVQQHYTSKQIARELGVGVDAVDQRIKCAMKTLGVSTRAEAARLLAVPKVDSLPHASIPQTISLNLAFGWLSRFSTRIYPSRRRGRFVFWSCLAAFALGSIQFGLPLDFLLRDWSSRLHRHPASGDIVIVALQRPNPQVGEVWNRSHFARLADRLNGAGSERVAFSMLLDQTTDSESDHELAAALQRLGRRAILVAGDDILDGKRVAYLPLPEFSQNAVLSNGAAVSVLWSVRGLPYSKEVSGARLPSLAAELAGWLPQHRDPSIAARVAGLEVVPPPERWFLVDYSIDPDTVPVVNAEDILRNSFARSQIEGKVSVIARTYVADPYPRIAPVFGMRPNIYIDVLGAETLRAGPPTWIPWTLPYLAAVLVLVGSVSRRSSRFSQLVIGGSIVGLLSLPFVLKPQEYFLEVATPTLLLVFCGVGFSWVWLQRRWTQ